MYIESRKSKSSTINSLFSFHFPLLADTLFFFSKHGEKHHLGPMFLQVYDWDLKIKNEHFSTSYPIRLNSIQCLSETGKGQVQRVCLNFSAVTYRPP